jgi:uncharacterized sporulation protein YeaH/YhbH (DUF444 family)
MAKSKNTIIDRRKNKKGKSSENRAKFMKRYKESIKDAVKKQISDQNIKDIGTTGTDISIDKKDISEPTFSNDFDTGIRRGVNPGNKHYDAGDIIPRPDGGGGGKGTKGSDSGDGEDSFEFSISREEFMDIFFEDLELPNLVETSLKNSDEYKWKRAGFTNTGTPASLDLTRTMKQSLGRRFALKKPKQKELIQLQIELENILSVREIDRTDEQKERILVLEEMIKEQSSKIQNVPFIDDIDLKYRVNAKEIVPTTSAVVFCLMDVSGSMGEHEKDLSKRFFTLLHLFLVKHYKKVDIRFLRHHHDAKEVSEDEFFNDRDTGGTVVSKVFDLMAEIIEQEYTGGGYNIYACHASDGDNFSSDDAALDDVMVNKILPKVQHFAYLEVKDPTGWRSSSLIPTQLWTSYLKYKESMSKVGMVVAKQPSDIYPVFRELFKKG